MARDDWAGMTDDETVLGTWTSIAADAVTFALREETWPQFWQWLTGPPDPAESWPEAKSRDWLEYAQKQLRELTDEVERRRRGLQLEREYGP